MNSETTKNKSPLLEDRALRIGTYLALATALISGTSNFLNKIAVKTFNDPIVFTTFKNVLVASILVGLLIFLKKKKEIFSLNRGQMLKLAAVGAVGGSIPFALFFTGLTQTSALNASLIHKTLFLWVIILAAPFLKEKMAPAQWIGIAAIFGGNLVVGGFAGFKFNVGELMILGATMLWAVENIIAKKVLADVSSTVVAGARMFIGSLILLPIAISRGGLSLASGLSPVQWAWTLVSVALLTGYVVTWYAALKRAPASYVATLLVPATLVTNVLSALFITHAFTPSQLGGTALFLAGTFTLIVHAGKMKFPKREAVSLEQNPTS